MGERGGAPGPQPGGEVARRGRVAQMTATATADGKRQRSAAPKDTRTLRGDLVATWDMHGLKRKVGRLHRP